MEDHFYDSRTYSGLTATLNAAEAAAYMNGGRRPTFPMWALALRNTCALIASRCAALDVRAGSLSFKR
jgi:hypothetical protein